MNQVLHPTIKYPPAYHQVKASEHPSLKPIRCATHLELPSARTQDALTIRKAPSKASEMHNLFLRGTCEVLRSDEHFHTSIKLCPSMSTVLFGRVQFPEIGMQCMSANTSELSTYEEHQVIWEGGNPRESCRCSTQTSTSLGPEQTSQLLRFPICESMWSYINDQTYSRQEHARVQQIANHFFVGGTAAKDWNFSRTECCSACFSACCTACCSACCNTFMWFYHLLPAFWISPLHIDALPDFVSQHWNAFVHSPKSITPSSQPHMARCIHLGQLNWLLIELIYVILLNWNQQQFTLAAIMVKVCHLCCPATRIQDVNPCQ